MAEQAEKFDPYHRWLGIAPQEQPPSYYRLLGLDDFETDLDAIAREADRTMAHVRTFSKGPRAAWSQRLLDELATARQCLLDMRCKAAYDQSLKVKRGIQGLPRRSENPAPGPGHKPPPQASSASASPPPPISRSVRAAIARRRARERKRNLLIFAALWVVLVGLIVTAILLFL